MVEPSAPSRKPYDGSCHCGTIKYRLYLTLPPPLIVAKPPSHSSTVRIRKCNCTTCHKMCFFHVRPMNPPNDFQLLSPSDPSQLSDYTCYKKLIHWYFCSKCGVRCFAFTGDGETREVEVDGETRKVWAPKEETWKGTDRGGTSYLTINAQTLEAGQEGLNLLEWTEKQWIAYLNDLHRPGEARLREPYPGGTY